MRIALLVGISGKIGKSLLDALLNNRHYKKTIVLTRHENRRLKNIHLKKVTVDFSMVENNLEDFNEVDDVFCLLGTDYINTTKIEDASLFDYEYPLNVARIAKKAGVKNFYLLSSSKSNIQANSEKLKVRAKLENQIDALGFENFYMFKINRVGKAINLDSGFYLAKRGFSSIINTIGMGVLDKVKSTPANILANKILEVAVSNPLEKRVFFPSDIN
jgi:hypothetical protein